MESLECYVVVVKPDGTQFRWDGSGDAFNIPSAITYGSKRNTGFDTMSCQLPRPLDIDFPDLDLFDDIYVKALTGVSRWEGRIVGVNRTTSADGSSIQVDAVGWMAHLQDQRHQMLYVDRELAGWGPPGAARRLALYTANFPASADPAQIADSSTPGIELGIDFPQAAPYKKASEAWYVSQVDIASFYLEWKLSSGASSYFFQVGMGSDDIPTSQTLSGNLAASTTGSITTSVVGRGAFAQWYFNATPAGVDGQRETAQIRNPAVYGNHGLTKQGTAPQGYFASDMLKHMVASYAPRLNTNGVQDTRLIIPHANWPEPTTVYDAALKLNGYHLWELAVWENHTLYWYPLDLTDWDWEVRTDDPGVEISLQGDTASDLVNGAIVHYDQLPGRQKVTVGPSDDSRLRNTDAANVINAHNIGYRPVEITLSFPVTREVAITMGEIALAEAQQPKRPGSIKVSGGYVRDRHGNLQPASKVRAADRVRITDIPGDVIRPIGETTWDQESLTLTMGVDSTIERLEGFFARVDVGLQAAGLAA